MLAGELCPKTRLAEIRRGGDAEGAAPSLLYVLTTREQGRRRAIYAYGCVRPDLVSSYLEYAVKMPSTGIDVGSISQNVRVLYAKRTRYLGWFSTEIFDLRVLSLIRVEQVDVQRAKLHVEPAAGAAPRGGGSTAVVLNGVLLG